MSDHTLTDRPDKRSKINITRLITIPVFYFPLFVVSQGSARPEGTLLMTVPGYRWNACSRISRHRMHYITCVYRTTRISFYKSVHGSVQPLLELGLRGLRRIEGQRVWGFGSRWKMPGPLVVPSNWNTILTLKPKIGEYSSFSPALFLPPYLWKKKKSSQQRVSIDEKESR